MKDSRRLTPAEFQIIEILWETPQALTVAEVLSFLSREKNVAYTTVMTLLDKMAKKGSLARIKQGRGYLYRPQVSCAEVLACVVDEFTGSYFGGKRYRLSEFLNHEAAAPGESESEGELDISLL